MKMFKTGSATVISDCQKFFRFLPITYQIDIRTASFLETFMISDNGILHVATITMPMMKMIYYYEF